MLLLHEFPRRYVVSASAPAGSIDEVSWLTADASGDDPNVVPSGAALFVRGWAIDLSGMRPASVVIICIDDTHSYEARVGISRPDVAAAMGSTALDLCGFEAVIPTGRFVDGEHALRLAVLEPDQNVFAYLAQSARFHLVGDGVTLPDLPQHAMASAGALDEVLDCSREKAVAIDDGVVAINPGTPLYLRGWACETAPRNPFREIYAIVDGRRAYRANAGIVRKDVAVALGAPELEPTGFDVHVPTIGLRRGVHEIAFLGLSDSADILVRTPVRVNLRIGGMGTARS